jgi:predicted TIM-barrel enzyme
MAGRGSLAGLLAYGNANEIVCEMAHEVLPVVKKTPVLAGVNGTRPVHDPRRLPAAPHRPGLFRDPELSSVGLIDGTFRANLEETGMGYVLEVELVARARSLDLLTTPYVFSEETRETWRGPGRHRRLPHGPDDGARSAPTPR